LIIESSPLLRGERAEISLLDDQTRRLLEELAGIIDEYNLRIQTAVFLIQGPLIEQNAGLARSLGRGRARDTVGPISRAMNHAD